MKYRRSIGTVRTEDLIYLVQILEDYLKYIQIDNESSNQKINDIKLMIHKLQHNIDLPVRQTYLARGRW